MLLVHEVLPRGTVDSALTVGAVASSSTRPMQASGASTGEACGSRRAGLVVSGASSSSMEAGATWKPEPLEAPARSASAIHHGNDRHPKRSPRKPGTELREGSPRAGKGLRERSEGPIVVMARPGGPLSGTGAPV